MNLLALLLVGLVLQQPTASVEGAVIQIGTGQPIAKAVVELVAESRGDGAAVATGADGRFAFRNFPAGSYQLRVSRVGYLDGEYGKRGPNGRGRSLSIAAGQTVTDVRLTMTPFGVVSGRIYDDSGEPMPNVTVRALKYLYRDGQRTLTQVKSDLTDDRGEYRLFWLPPGQYYIVGVPQGLSAEDAMYIKMELLGGEVRLGGAPAADRLGGVNVPVAYPGTADIQAATPVEVKPGAERGGIDFSIPKVSARTIRGTVTDGTTGRLAANASVTLVPRNSSATTQNPTRPLSDGTFEIKNVSPGSYFLVASARINVDANSFRIMGSRTPIDIRGADIDRMSIAVLPAIDIRGQITVEGSRDSAQGGRLNSQVSLKSEQPGVPGRFAQTTAQFDSADQFTLNDVIEGDYKLLFGDLPPGTYVKSARFGASDVLMSGLTLDPRAPERLEIVLGTNPGSMEGIVVDRDRRPVPNAVIAIVPDGGRRQRMDMYRSAWTDDAGRFRIPGIPPGDYVVLAWEDIEEGLWRDFEFLRRNEGAGKLIRVNEGSRDTIEVVAAPFAF